ncbi:MAG: NTP transferase domain-containing protein [Dermatophilaceae bacterium]
MSRAAIVLAGGRGSRLRGVRKVTMDVAGRHSLARVLDACRQWPAVVVGPADLPVPDGVRLVTDDPPFGGPVSALRAGLDGLPAGTDLVAVLAGDQPFVTTASLATLAGAVGDGEGAAYVTEGVVAFLCAVWRVPALRARVAAAGPAMRSVYAGAAIALVPDAGEWTLDVDTPADLARARARARADQARTTRPTPE